MLWPFQKKKKIKFRLPVRVPAKGSRIAIAAIFRDEQDYLAEWLKFHRAQGFDFFILYDNGSLDNGPEIARTLFPDHVIVLPWKAFVEDVGAQRLAYNHALANFGEMCSWMAFLDIDEFLFPLVETSMSAALKQFEDLPGIAVPWHMYGFSSFDEPPAGGVLKNFVYRAPFPPDRENSNWLLKYKSIVQPSRLLGGHVHLPMLDVDPLVFFNERRQRINRHDRANPNWAVSEIFRLNHYYTKDKRTYGVKLVKGRPNLVGMTDWKRKIILSTAAAVEASPVFDDCAARRSP